MFTTVISTTVSVTDAFFQVRESETLAQLCKGSDCEIALEIQVIFASMEPRPTRAAAVKAVLSYLIRMFALQGLKPCFCTECSLHLERAAPTAFWESGQKGICFYMDKNAMLIASWWASIY